MREGPHSEARRHIRRAGRFRAPCYSLPRKAGLAENLAMETIGREEFDVIVVGAGNAATCAALSARENGARVLMLEIAPEEARAGNSAFTGGAFRVVYHGGEDLARLTPDMNETELRDGHFGTYTEEQHFDDMGRLTQDP